MATGFARGAAARGKRIAFGDPKTRTAIEYSYYSELIFRNNPNIAKPGQENAPDLEWHGFRRGHRIYNMQHGSDTRWVWNRKFRPPRGEMFFTSDEIEWGKRHGSDLVIIEPNVARGKTVGPNKQWSPERFRQVAITLKQSMKLNVRQFIYPGVEHRLEHAKPLDTPTFRHALAAMAHAKLVITGEGGMHHGAAAMNVPAVVIFGGFIPPEVTGYDDHINLAHGTACGNYIPCPHCAKAMEAITVDMVIQAAKTLLAPPPAPVTGPDEDIANGGASVPAEVAP